MSEQMRKEFEEWAISENFDVSHSDHRYGNLDTYLAWQTWQASRAAIVVVMPESHNDWLDKQIVEYALEQAGVSYK